MTAMRTTIRRGAALAMVAVALLIPASALASGGAETALAKCLAAQGDSEVLQEGLHIAEVAVESDRRDARAHFAVFCNLGKKVEMEGIGFGTLGAVRRLRKEIDLALQLAPDDPEILAAKGAFLLELPRALGGDVREAEHLLRRAISLNRENAEARQYLARIRGELDG